MFSNVHKNKYVTIFHMVFLSVAILLTIRTLSEFGYLKISGDSGWPLSASAQLKRNMYPWISVGMGVAALRTLPTIPLWLVGTCLEAVGVSAITFQWLFYVFMLISGWLGIYILALFFFKMSSSETGFLKCFFASIVSIMYFSNPFALQLHLNIDVSYTPGYMGTPLLAYLTIQILRTNKRKYYLAIIIFFLLFSSVFLNPTVGFAMIMPSLLFTTAIVCFPIFTRRKNIFFNRLVQHLKLWLLILLINIWWILPLVTTPGLGSDPSISSDVYLDWMRWKSANASFLNNFRMMTYVGWTEPFHRISALWSFAGWFLKNFWGIISTFIPPLLIGFILVIKKSLFKKSHILFLVTVFLVWIFLTKGSHSPFGAINEWLHQTILPLKAFRSIEWYQITNVVFYSLLTGCGLIEIYRYALKSKKIASFTLTFSLTLLFLSGYVYHLWFIPIVPSYYFVKPPAYNMEAIDFINSRKSDECTLVLPLSHGGCYTWKHDDASEILTMNTTNSVLDLDQVGYSSGGKIAELLRNFFDSDSIDLHQFKNLCRLFDVKYVAMRKDLATRSGEKFQKIPLKRKYQSLLSQLKKIKAFGKIEFYEIPAIDSKANFGVE